MATKILFDGAELLEDYNNELPITINDVLLLSPGVWNNTKYTADEITNAYANTDWSNRSYTSLYLDHQDTKEAGVGNWVGYVKNARVEGGTLKGDLQIWNPLLALYLNKAKAKFGISATLRGQEDPAKSKMEDFHFESFSVVTKPACKDALINLAEQEKGPVIRIITYPDISQDTMLKGGKMSENTKTLQQEETKVPDNTVEPEKVDEESMKKKECLPTDQEQMSDEEFGNITLNSNWTEFVNKLRQTNPNLGFKDIAMEFKKQFAQKSEMESLTDEELLAKYTEIGQLLKARNKLPMPEQKEEPAKVNPQDTPVDSNPQDKPADVNPEDEAKKKKQDEEMGVLAEMKKELAEIRAKLNEPDSKTVNLSSNVSTRMDPIDGMVQFLLDGKGGEFSI